MFRQGADLRGIGDLGVGRRAGVDRLLYETEKQLAAALGFSPVKAKDVVRGSRRRMAMKTSPVVRIEIGAMLRGHLYNTNRVGCLVR